MKFKKRYIIPLVILIILLALITIYITKDQIQKSPDNLIGGQRSEQGCLGPAGYTYNSFMQACIREWELNENEKRLAKIAVDHITPYPSLTVTEVEQRLCTGCFIVHLTDKDFKIIQVNFDNWEIVE